MAEHITQITTKIFCLTFISRILGLLRDLALAWLVGAGVLADILACALRLPHLARRLLQEGLLSLTLISTLLKLKNTASNENEISKDIDNAEFFFSKTKDTLFIILCLILIVGYVLSGILASLLAPNFDHAKHEELTSLIKISLPYLLFVGMSALWMARLHAAKLFFVPAALPILLNISILMALAIAYIFDLPYGPTVLWSISLAGLLQWLLQKLAYVKSQTKSFFKSLKLTFNLQETYKRLKAYLSPKKLDANAALGQTDKSAVSQTIGRIPLGLLASSTQHLLLLIAMIFLSNLGDGYVAAQFYAERILELPLGLIAVSLGLASLPILTQFAAQEKWSSLTRQLSQAIHWAWLLIVPATAGLAVVNNALITLLFAHGQFDHESILRTSAILQAYLPLIPAATFNRLLLSACLALDGLKFSALTTLLCTIWAITASVAGFYPPYVAVGCLWLATIILSIWLKIQLAQKKAKIILAYKTLFKSTLCSILACALAALILNLISQTAQILSLILAISSAIGAWMILLKLISPNDWRRLKKILKLKN